MPRSFDFTQPITGSSALKAQFLRRARAQLKAVAGELGLAPGSYDLRVNKGGPSVSGAVTLHADHVYVQAQQSALGFEHGILVRACKGRTDYKGGPNTFAPLDLLSRPDLLAIRIQRTLALQRPRPPETPPCPPTTSP